MPIRTASLAHQIQKNGARLHLAMASRVHSQGADHPASEEEQALLEERRLLKEAQAQRRAQAALPRPKAAKRVFEPKPPKEPKAPKAAKEPKEKPKAAPACAYVPTAQGSSFAAPLMRPGRIRPSSDRSRLRGGVGLLFSTRMGPGDALGLECKRGPSGNGTGADADMNKLWLA